MFEQQIKFFFGKKCLIFVVFLSCFQSINANPDAKRLYDDLLSNYNRLIRPVSNNTDTVLVKLGLRLSQLIDLVSSLKFCEFFFFGIWFDRNHKYNWIESDHVAPSKTFMIFMGKCVSFVFVSSSPYCAVWGFFVKIFWIHLMFFESHSRIFCWKELKNFRRKINFLINAINLMG